MISIRHTSETDRTVGRRWKGHLPRWCKNREKLRAVARSCAVALVCVVVAFVLRLVMNPLLGEDLPFMLFVAAALVATVWGGAMAGGLALVFGLLLGDVFLEWSRTAVVAVDSLNWLRIVRYLFTVSVGVTLIEAMRRNQLKTRNALEALEHEVTRRKASEAQLMEAKRELSRHAETLQRLVAERTSKLQASLKSMEGMVYHIAHNLRAPLRAMNGFAVVIQEEYEPRLDERGKLYTARIAAASHSMDQLISDLLALGRLSYAEMKPEKIDLHAALETAVKQLAEKIKTSGAKVELQGPLQIVWASRNELGQALFQLLDNALKFVAPGVKPHVQIRAEERGSAVRLMVRDNGIGIEPAYHDRVFTAFEKLEGEAYEGTGIGLAIVKESALRMNGKVGVESERGKGSCFWIELPRANGAAVEKH